jgi:hypothetical protein
VRHLGRRTRCADVSDDADDGFLARIVFRSLAAEQALAERVLARPERVGDRLADDCHAHSARTVVGREIPALEQRHPHRGEILWRDDPEPRRQQLIAVDCAAVEGQ